MDLHYSIKRPTVGRRGFGLTCYTLDGRNKTYHRLAPELADALAAINGRLKAGVITAADAETSLYELIEAQHRGKRLSRRAVRGARLSEVNQKCLDAYLKTRRGRLVKEKKAPEYRLKKAFRLLEPLPLLSSTAEEIQAHLIKKCKGDAAAVKRMIGYLRPVLKRANRHLEFERIKQPRRKIVHWNLDQFMAVHSKLPDGLKDFALAMFASGLRPGEMFALEPDDLIDGKWFNVTKQVDMKGNEEDPKWGSVGMSFISDFGRDSAARWVERTDKMKWRDKADDELKAAFKAAFPDSRDSVRLYTLRHSHARLLFNQGMSYGDVAEQLRNSEAVCKKYYIGWEQSKDRLARLEALIDGKKKPQGSQP